MKKILAILSIVILILTSGCSNAAGTMETSSAAPVTASESSTPDNEKPDKTKEDISNMRTHPSDASRRDAQNEVLGKITAISENKITLAIGTVNRPESIQGEKRVPPASDGSRPESAPAIPNKQRDGSTSRVERAEDGSKRGSGFSGSSMNLEYTGEEISYTLPDSAQITKGIGENSEKLTTSDLAVGDIVRLTLDEAEQPVSVQVFEINK